MPRLRGLYILDRSNFDLVYGPQQQQAIARHVEIIADRQTRESIESNPQLLSQANVIFTGWSPPRFDDSFFARAAQLQAIFYAGGNIGLPASAWRKGIRLTTSHVANSQAVAEFALATIVLSLKHGWRLMRETHTQRRFVDRNTAVPGCYRASVGLIGMGMIGRLLRKLLAPLELDVLVYDPLLSEAEAHALGVRMAPLDQLFARCDVVSLHAPLYSETCGLITGAHLAAMRYGATFINTARGGIVRTDELIEVAEDRADLHFLLDVTDPLEPPPADSKLYDLPNVILTPHMAGSTGNECRRLGQCMVEELERFVSGERMRWEETPPAMEPPRKTRVEVQLAPFVQTPQHAARL